MSKKFTDFEICFYERIVRERPDYGDALILLAEAYTARGDYAKGLSVDLTLARLYPHDANVHYNLACSLALVGRKDESFDAIRRAIELGYRDFHHLKKDADLKSLHDDARFDELIHKSIKA
ncbi:MAG: hypothetical protein PHN49_07225 [Candidatus Omnitrophica bacterium]|nr:hypothetical protein [Candidatus Omnitrophota bacterium]MDD5671412.1 hypothetical protein [Candidatus Omnitrophota bacterium]